MKLSIDWASVGLGLVTSLTYFIMYMFRKPFTGAAFTEMQVWGVDYKSSLIIAQVMGYATSKFIGIRLIPSMENRARMPWLIGLFGFAFLSLLGFSLAGLRWGVFWMFLNGLPLGLIWGIVFRYCEGRRLTEVFTVFLASNFILSSGIAKSWAGHLLQGGISEQQMPFLISLYCLPALGVLLYFLSRSNAPSEADIIQRSERALMTRADRLAFFRDYKTFIIGFLVMYTLLTVMRDIRDNFAVEIWQDVLGKVVPSVYTIAEIPVMLFCLISIGSLYRIRNNGKALNSMLWMMVFALLIMIGFSVFLRFTATGAILWMSMTGIGLFIPYILMNGIVFDRFIAHFQVKGNVGYLMYLCDAIGYLGSVAILLMKNFSGSQLKWGDFFLLLCLGMGSVIVIIVLVLIAWFKSDKYTLRIMVSPD